MLLRSASGRSGSSIAPTLLVTGMLSPVSADSSTLRSRASRMRASAGMRLPGCSRIRSPGTMSCIAIVSASPPRTTCTSGSSSRVSDWIVRSALDSVTNPMTPLTTITPRITMPSAMPPVAMDSTVEPARSSTGSSLNWSANMAKPERVCARGSALAE
jgi:hypothetical protein